jgi:tetratricopeptide (TPR) repeat protein
MRLVFILLASLIIVPGIRPANAQQSTAAQTRIALVIGNANYQDADTPLKDPVGDARALGSALQRAGFDVDVAEDLTKDAMRRTLDRFYDKIKPGTVTLIFFSGYGIQSNRQNYLIPTDAHIWTEADVRREGTSLAAILSELGNRQPNAAIAVLEAARRNPFERRYRLTPAGLAAITATPGTLIAHAAAPNALLDDTNRGLFVGELIKQIGKADSPVEDVFGRTSLAVSQASQGGQVPWVSSALGDQVLFGQKSTTAPATSQSKVAAVEPAKPAEQQTTGPMLDANPAVATDKATPSEPAKPQASEQSASRQNKPSNSPANPQTATATAPSTAADSGSSTNTSTALVARVDPDAGRISSTVINPADDAAIKALDAKLVQNPNDANAFYRRGQLYAKNGVLSHAADDFDAAIRLNPKDAEAYNNRCWVRAMVADPKTALSDCDEALRLRPGFADALDSRGLVHLKLSMSQSAIADYDAALKIKPNQASSLYGRGIGKLRIGKAAEGNADIAAAKAINSGIVDEFASYGIR